MPAFYPRGDKTLAGQPPQEPPWRPQEQDHGRQDWQAYSPPSAADGQETYAYPHSAPTAADYGQGSTDYGQGYAQDRAAFAPPAPETRIEPAITEHDQPYAGANQSYAGADQSYTRVDQPYGGADQTYAGPSGTPAPDPGAPQWQDQGAPQWQDQSTPQWQSQAASQWKAKRQGSAKATSGSKGFVSSLFDFSFNSFVTPKIIKALYVLVTIWTVIWAVIFLVIGFKTGGMAGGVFTLIVVVPVFGLLTLGACRMLFEFFMIMHRIHDELRTIRERGDNRP
jgi:hypothetical protein